MITSVYLRGDHCEDKIKPTHKYLCEEGDGLAALAGAARATDPVGVVLDGLGHVVVEDEGDVLDVDASARHVRGHEDVLWGRGESIHYCTLGRGIMNFSHLKASIKEHRLHI